MIRTEGLVAVVHETYWVYKAVTKHVRNLRVMEGGLVKNRTGRGM